VTQTASPPPAPDWVTCPHCRTVLYGRRLADNLRVCPECGNHHRLTAPERLAQLLDPGTVAHLQAAVRLGDPLTFVDTKPYADRWASSRAKTGMAAAVAVARGRIEGNPVVTAVMDFRFLGGSLGGAVGELITLAAEMALAERTPLLLVTASGGARMQEGAISLMQMAKTAQALGNLDRAGVLTVSLVTDPTYGGVAASFATLADVIVAEPAARMGFAGPRVIAQTTRQELPPGFQTAEFLLEHGLVDDVRPRAELRAVLGRLLAIGTTATATGWGAGAVDPVLRDAGQLPVRPAWKTVQFARNPGRPTTLEHIGAWLDGFVELRGDRAGEDCRAVVGGVGRLDGLPVMVIGHQKGHTTAELVSRNFGMSSPAGYRKVARLLRLAAKLALPVVTLIDTPGADPGIEAERHGQAVAIAEGIRQMGGLPVPVVAVVTGEGGSGGALALGVADRVLMCANSTYSVISPEGCAAILWKAPHATTRAAEALRLDPAALLRLGVVDGVVPEPDGGAHADPAAASELVRQAVVCALRELRGTPAGELVGRRRERFRRFGLATTPTMAPDAAPAAGTTAGEQQEVSP
jgi:acyl-CoA carboxylase subunit beta